MDILSQVKFVKKVQKWKKLENPLLIRNSAEFIFEFLYVVRQISQASCVFLPYSHAVTMCYNR